MQRRYLHRLRALVQDSVRVGRDPLLGRRVEVVGPRVVLVRRGEPGTNTANFFAVIELP